MQDATDYFTSLTYTDIFAAIVAFALPLIVILIRNNLRKERVGLILEIEKAFDLKETIPSFEFVKSKYFDEAAQVSGAQLYLSALPYMLLSALGLMIILTPMSSFAENGPQKPLASLLNVIFVAAPDPACGNPCADVMSPVSGAPTTTAPPAVSSEGAPPANCTAACGDLIKAATVLAFVFAGAILFSLNYLVRAVGNFELGPLTFLRVTMHMLFALATAMTLWRLLPNLGEGSSLSPVFYGVAFIIGFFPEFGLRFLVSKLALPMKGYRQDLAARAPVVPIEVIDGIDSSIAYRLQEQQIYDVQNLATCNPIMLHVETPFGLYESIDWVAQAQLCTTVGPDTFFELRKRNIRTIFDLERATVDPRATPTLRRDLARIAFRLQDTEFASPVTPAPAPVAPPDVVPVVPGAPAAAAPALFSDGDIHHLFEVMMDDLHIHRLRQIWELIVRRLGPQYSHLSPIVPPR